MFTNIMQPNMNGVGGTPFASNIQVNNINGQNGFDTDSFIKILTAIVSGFNDTVMNLEGGLFAGKDSQPITVDDVSKGLFVGNDGNVVAGETLSGILQQMISQMQLIGVSQPVIAINQDNQKTIEVPNNPTSQIHVNVNGNTALVNFIMKSEDGMQKVKVHTNDNFNANSDGNAFVQIKTMADTVNGQEFQNIIPKNDKGDSPFLKEGMSPLSNSASAMIRNIGNDQHMHIKTTLSKKDLEFNFSILNKKEIEPAVNISDAKTHLVVNEKDGGMIASASHLYNAPYVKNDSAIVVKEPIHISRLHELGEVMEKTVKAGDKHLIIKIEPPDLGSIQIKLGMDNGMLRADLKVDSPAVKDLFSMAIPQIKTSLEDSGIKVSDFFVDVKEDYYSDGRRQQDDTNQQQHKQNKGSKSQFFDYFA
ncbi:flagellar hook-length control protein FliK [Dissulfurispira sp.]|uniref:flagellar hook-length control protein FliK n=1 Tax=Dissulfurispira sp. TaxID=2817609 RepID=UPI002FD90932